MTIDHDKIVVLYLESLTGTISPEDAALLSRELASGGPVKKLWEQLEREGNTPEMQHFLRNLEPETELHQLKKRLQLPSGGSTRLRRMAGWGAAAAAIVAVSIAAFFLLQQKKITDSQAIASVIREKKDAVRLKLASGTSVDLDQTADQLTLGNTVLNLGGDSLNFNSTDTATNQLTIPRGGSYTLTLSDGTVVMLNADSKLRFPFRFGGTTRDVYLEGEAYFKVFKDKAHPFIVHTPLTTVEVVGTQFNVNTYKQGTVSTALVEGKVLTGIPGGAAQPLQPGHVAVYNTTKGFAVEEADMDDIVAWVKGVYYFHDLPLRELVALMSRCYGVSVSIDQQTLPGRSVSGVMDRNNLPELLEDLKTTIGIKYYYSGATLHIYR
ncbi:FecR family protein [Niabella beijingensis]|uniref:FecR family protein n=1 Tax=Niabella beijingensis TaxID=2872700 RepID=UPI001CBD2D7D|nr:FecR domain-containing protein [Niabella beijingensis]MBZ4190596.1 FecR domain-containing protein [Niabella beijingensis]